MSDFFDVYHHQVKIPKCKYFMALPDNRILASHSKSLTELTCTGETISKFELQQQPYFMHPSKNNSVIIKSKSRISKLDLVTKEITVIRQSPNLSQQVRFIGQWNGGLAYIENSKLHNNKEEVDNSQCIDYQVEVTNRGNIVKYKQIKENAQSHSITIYSLSNEADQEQVVEATTYNITENMGNKIIMKVQETNDSLVVFMNHSFQGWIVEIAKKSMENKGEIAIRNDIVDVLKFDEESGTAILLAKNRAQGVSKAVGLGSPKQTIVIVNFKSGSVVNTLGVPRLTSYSCHPESSVIFFTPSVLECETVQSLRLVKKNRIYMHMMIQLGMNRRFGEDLIKQAVKVLTE